MIIQQKYPVLEFDTDLTSKLDPYRMEGLRFDTDKLIITFFPEVTERLEKDGDIEKAYTIAGENPIYIYRFTDQRDVLITLGYVGCPACAGNLDYFHAHGIGKVMFCGGGGVLDENIKVGQLLVVEEAIRDEGFSYQYIKPSRTIRADEETVGRICRYLDEREVSYLRGTVWTTDAIFRETNERIALRKSEGAKIVEMEQAGCLAVAQFRGFDYGAIIYGGDDMSREQWDNRGWRSVNGIRYDLVRLCEELVRRI